MNNSLTEVHPELVSEWSEKNLPLTPDSITFGSNKKVWWKGACGHEWETSIKARQNISDNLLKELKSSHHYEDAHRRALTIPEQELFLDFLSDESSQYYHWFPIFTVMVGTGMRVGEVTGLRWEDIDLNAGMIDVNHTLAYYKHRDENGCYFSIHSPKTRAGRRQIPMTEDVKNAFLLEEKKQEWKNRQEEDV